MVNSPYYDNQYWEHHLPINPPGNAFRTDTDVVLESVEIANWLVDGEYVFKPRLKDTVQMTKTRRRRGRAVEDDD